MHPLTDFSLIATNELSVVNTSSLKFTYEIRDDQHAYARINDPEKFIGTLANKWTFEKDSSWAGEFTRILIKDNGYKSVGFFTFDSNTKNLLLEMNNGFKAELVRTRYLLGLKSDYVWKNVNAGDIMTLKESAWNGKTPIKITLHISINKHATEMELMLLYGVAFSLDARFHHMNLPLGFY